MLATRGLGRPGGLLVAGGLGRGVYVPLEWLPDVAPYEITFTDPAALRFVDLASVLVEDHLATLFYDRGSDTYADMVLTAIDPHELTNHETIELHADTTREVIA